MASGTTNWLENVCFRVSSVKIDRQISIGISEGIINSDLGIYNNLYSIRYCVSYRNPKRNGFHSLHFAELQSTLVHLYQVCFQILINFQSRLIDIRINNRSTVSICISFRYLSNFSFSIYCHTRDLFPNASVINFPLKVFRFTAVDRKIDEDVETRNVISSPADHNLNSICFKVMHLHIFCRLY